MAVDLFTFIYLRVLGLSFMNEESLLSLTVDYLVLICDGILKVLVSDFSFSYSSGD